MRWLAESKRAGPMRNYRTHGGIPGSFLTFSLLLLVMAIGFVVGRVVARSYTKAPLRLEVSPLPEQQRGTKPAGDDQAAVGRVYVPAPTSPRQPPDRASGVESEEITEQEAQQEQQAEPGVEAPAAAVPLGEALTVRPEGRRSRPFPGSSEGVKGGETKGPEYSIQVGVFTLLEGAREVTEGLTRAGHAARIEVETRDGQPFYRVLAGRYTTEQEARTAQEALGKEGFPGFLVRQ